MKQHGSALCTGRSRHAGMRASSRYVCVCPSAANHGGGDDDDHDDVMMLMMIEMMTAMATQVLGYVNEDIGALEEARIANIKNRIQQYEKAMKQDSQDDS